MADHTKIEWTDATWNPLRGCSRVSDGCRNCYAERVASRFAAPGQPYHGIVDPARPGSKWTGRVDLIEHLIDQPLRWKKPRRIFVNSMSDLFHEQVPDEWIDRVFAVMALAPQHTFQVLTKRPERMREYLTMRDDLDFAERLMRGARKSAPLYKPWTAYMTDWALHPGAPGAAYPLTRDPTILAARENARIFPLPNVWLGVSVEDQAAADERIPHLLGTPAAARWISAEPLLGPIDLTKCVWLDCNIPEYGGAGHEFVSTVRGLDWIVAGGESGPNARPMHPNWARSLRDQCAAAGVPFFFKQWGEWREFDTGSPEVITVENDSEIADNLAVCAIRPGLISQCGQFVARRDDLAFDVPYRLVERVGKKAAGSLLDGREHKDFPQ